MKRKKKNAWLWLVLLLLLLVAAGAVIWLVKGRGSGAGEEGEEVRAVCERFLTAYQDGDEEAVTELLAGAGYGSGPVSLEGYPALVGSRIRCTAEAARRQEDGSLVIPVKITALDLPALAEEAEFQRRATEGNLLEVLGEYLEEGKAPETVYEVSVQMIQENGEWKVRMDNTLSNALLGGYGTFYIQMAEEMAGEQK